MNKDVQPEVEGGEEERDSEEEDVVDQTESADLVLQEVPLPVPHVEQVKKSHIAHFCSVRHEMSIQEPVVHSWFIINLTMSIIQPSSNVPAASFLTPNTPKSRQEFRSMLRQGIEVRKHGRNGRAKKLVVWCDDDFSGLYWHSSKGSKITRGGLSSPSLDTHSNIYHFDLKKVHAVIVGSSMFRTSCEGDACFSLVTQERSLDVEMPSSDLRNAMVRGFEELLRNAEIVRKLEYIEETQEL